MSTKRLRQVSSFPLAAMFGMCAMFLLVCALCQRRLEHLVHAAPSNDAELADSNTALLIKAGGSAVPNPKLHPGVQVKGGLL